MADFKVSQRDVYHLSSYVRRVSYSLRYIVHYGILNVLFGGNLRKIVLDVQKKVYRDKIVRNRLID